MISETTTSLPGIITFHFHQLIYGTWSIVFYHICYFILQELRKPIWQLWAQEWNYFCTSMQNTTIFLRGKVEPSLKQGILLVFTTEKHFSPSVLLIFQLTFEIPPWKSLLPVILLIKQYPESHNFCILQLKSAEHLHIAFLSQYFHFLGWCFKWINIRGALC